MVGTGQFLAIILLAVILLVVLILKFNVHPVLALFISGMFTGIGIGYPVDKAIDTFVNGFGSTLGSIGCVIIFGSIIAQGVRDTNSIKSMVNFFITLFRGKCLELSTAMAAYIMSIPVFGDITQVLVAPIASTIAKRDKKSMSTMAGFTLLGCSLTHAIVPPTPGILAVSVMLGADLGMVIIWGIVVSFIAFMLTWILTKGIVAKEYIPPRADYVAGVEDCDNSDYHNLLIKDKGLPPVIIGAAPILLPVILIAAASFANMYLEEGSAMHTFWNTIGNKNIALFLGVVATMLIGFAKKDVVKENYEHYTGKKEDSVLKIMVNGWVEDALMVALIPLLVTAMGGGFSAVIKSYEGMSELGAAISSFGFPNFLLPFMIGVLMMVAVGSRTTAGMTAAAICTPMLGSLGLTPVAVAVLIGSGTMVGSHLSDSGFWVGTSLFNLNVKQGLKYITLLGSFCGILCLIISAAFVTTGLM
jgi:gluconate:H+ symporter, GntP family